MNKTNLLKLAIYLLSGDLKADFDMSRYSAEDYFGVSAPPFTQTTCGTIGCAVGHGPYAKIPKKETETWQSYASRVFGIYVLTNEFRWIFSAEWRNTDNTPEGAGKRILYLLRYGVPDNIMAQVCGVAERCYLNEKL